MLMLMRMKTLISNTHSVLMLYMFINYFYTLLENNTIDVTL